MRTLGTIILCITVLVTGVAGSDTASKEIQITSQSERTDVFTEIKTAEPIPGGSADILIRANIKTPQSFFQCVSCAPAVNARMRVIGRTSRSPKYLIITDFYTYPLSPPDTFTENFWSNITLPIRKSVGFEEPRFLRYYV